jgi:hypothetical protein
VPSLFGINRICGGKQERREQTMMTMKFLRPPTQTKFIFFMRPPSSISSLRSLYPPPPSPPPHPLPSSPPLISHFLLRSKEKTSELRST